VASSESEPGTDPQRTIVVPDIRDYHRINREVVQSLELGTTRLRLAGVEGQRLLLHGLTGPWTATIVIDGSAGPELASELNARGITVICAGGAADGAGCALVSGTLVVLGACGTAVGYDQRDGMIAAAAAVGPRAGLDQKGGCLILGGAVGRLAGERQGGGWLLLLGDEAVANLGYARRGGRLVSPDERLPGTEPLGGKDLRELAELALRCAGGAPELAARLRTLSTNPGDR
jgi:glutamate synthase domain-containing protein 3